MSKSALCIVLALMLWRTDCCKLDKHMRVVDKLEAVVIVGFDKPPKCVQPPHPYTGRQGLIGNPVPVWIRAVRFDDVVKPLSGRMVQLDVVDVFGRSVPGEVSISQSRVATNKSGFNADPLSLTCNTNGEYLIRAVYDDKRTKSVSYSAPVLCRSR